MSFAEWIALAGAASAILVLTAQLAFGSRSVASWALAGALGTRALESLFFTFALHAATREGMEMWQTWSQGVIALIPGFWLVFALTYARGNYREFLKRWFIPVIAAFAIPLSCLPFAMLNGFGTLEQPGTPLDWRFRLLWPSLLIHSTCLVAAVVSLVNLEWTFRASVGTVRWRLKYAIVGFSVLFGTRIYTSSQTIFYSGVTVGSQVFNSIALVLACLLIGVTLIRSRLDEIDLYPSASVIYRSLTAVLVGIYLVLVGVLAEWANWKGADAAFPLKALLLFLAIAALGVMAFSDRLRQRLRLMVSRHFARPFHDYRQVWATFTERTASLVKQNDYCQAVVKLVAETFDVLSVSLWLDDERTGLLQCGAATTIGEPEVKPGDEVVLAEMRRAHRARPLPLNIDVTREEWSEVLKRLHPSRFAHGGYRFAMPLVSADEFVGVLMLGDRVSGLAFTPDDADLLKCLGDQVAASLRNLGLSTKLVELREFEAYQMFSTFLVHDLKNTASTLSLMLRNMPAHFGNPAFREDALRGLGKSVDRINDLILRLTHLRQEPVAVRVPADLNEILATAVRKIESQPNLEVVCKLDALPPVKFDPRQMESVFTNLILNARDAVEPGGRITVACRQIDGWVVVSIEDNGCGMSKEFLARSLFRPFQTTKKKGMGIGLFQCKMMVEAHAGRIEVQTTPGQGTIFRVYLPIAIESKPSTHEAALVDRR